MNLSAEKTLINDQDQQKLQFKKNQSQVSQNQPSNQYIKQDQKLAQENQMGIQKEIIFYEKTPIQKLKQKILQRSKTQQRIESLKSKINQKFQTLQEINGQRNSQFQAYLYDQYPNPFQKIDQEIKLEDLNEPVHQLNYNQFYGPVQHQPQPFEHIFQALAPKNYAKQRLLKRKPQQRKVKITLHPETLKQAIKMFRAYDQRIQQGISMSLNTIARVLGCNCSSVWNLYKEYHQDPMLCDKFAKIRKKDKPMRRLKLERMRCILKLVQSNPYLNQRQMSDILNDVDFLKPNGKQMPSHLMTQLLKCIGYFKMRTFSSPADRNKAEFIEKRFTYCTNILKIKKDLGKIYYLDFQKFNCYSVRERIWLKKSDNKAQYPIMRDNNVSILAIMGDHGHTKCSVKLNSQIQENIIQVIDSILAQFVQSQKDTPKNNNKYIMINTLRLTPQVKQTIMADATTFAKYGITVDTLPQKSHQLNPLHSWFHELKMKIRPKKPTTQDDLFTHTKAAVQALTDSQARQFYQRVTLFHEKGVNRQSI